MKATLKLTLLGLFCAGMITTGFTGCVDISDRSSFDIASVKTYRDIPGVTAEETAAIEALISSREFFSLGVHSSTEAFIQSNGLYAGFSAKFCKLLSDLFGIPFVMEFNAWNDTVALLDSGGIDFTASLTPTSERRQTYYMTYPFAERSLAAFTWGDSAIIETDTDLNGLRVGIIADVVISAAVFEAYPELSFETVPVKDGPEAVEMLASGAIDVLISFAMDSYLFDANPSIRSAEILPFVYCPAVLAAAKPEFAPVISVLDKYLEAGGIDRFAGLYAEGAGEYSKYKFLLSLTGKETAWLNDLRAADSTVPVALERDNYPVCFYNEKEKAFQGIAVDILDEISNLTGITFYEPEPVGADSSREKMIEKLAAGEISLIPELPVSEDRKDDFLRSERYASSNFALLSKTDYPYMRLYQVIRATVGVARNSGFDEIFNLWFPNHPNLIYYDSQTEAVEALRKGEIDLLATSEKILLMLRNYLEKPEYKINVTFNMPPSESYFGFNKNEETLNAVFSKALRNVDAAEIEKSWTNRVFDYSRKLAHERMVYSSVSAVILLLLLIIMIVLFVKSYRTRELYRNQMATLSAIYDSLPDLVYSKDANGVYTSCNGNFADYMGLRAEKIIGKKFEDIFPGKQLINKAVFDEDHRVMNDAVMVKTEDWSAFPDRAKRLYEIIKVPLFRAGKVTGLLGIDRDITEHDEALKAAYNASKAKSNFLARMSHEIRTPMNAIIGMAELALRASELDTAKKHLHTVKQAGSHLLSIINDILDFSKIEEGKLEIFPGEYLFSSLVNDVISIIRMRVIDSQVRFAVFIESAIPNSLVGDETRIRQVLLNLLTNAVKYTEKGFVSLTVRAESVDNDNDTINLVMEVMDSGKGIKEDDLKLLFNEYVKIDAEKNKGIEGAGLGLAISYNIVKAMGGTISVHSEYNKGSTFTVTLSQKIHSRGVFASVNNPAEKKVIVHERREINAHSFVCAFDDLGVDCTLVSSDEELFSKLESENYSFIFIPLGILKHHSVALSKYGKNAKIVALAEFGAAVTDKGYGVLSMPAYSLSIANILNGVSDNFVFPENTSNIAMFAAPEARILVVDDIQTNLKVAEGLLLPYRMNVDLCAGGKEAIEAVASVKYDLIFMDHKMPEMDGIETTLRIRGMAGDDGYYKTVPIIALTANAVSGTKETFLRCGFNDFLSKPIDIVRLNVMLEKWIPKEKRKSASSESARIVPLEELVVDEDISIEGLDIKKGVFFSGGTVKSFFETLAIFHQDGLKKIRDIRECLEQRDWNLYTIHVHALKSASANIGADDLSETAKALETAGEQKELDYIESYTGELLSALESLLEKIKTALVLYREKEKKETQKYNTEQLRRELAGLRSALKTLDAGAINNSIQALQEMIPADESGAAAGFEGIAVAAGNTSGSIDGATAAITINYISDKILYGDYDEAVTMIDALLGGEHDRAS